MPVCVYTTNHSRLLDHMFKICSPDDEVNFRSNLYWKTGKLALNDARGDSIAILNRKIDEDGLEDFVCSFIAELLQAYFRSEFPKDLRFAHGSTTSSGCNENRLKMDRCPTNMALGNPNITRWRSSLPKSENPLRHTKSATHRSIAVGQTREIE